MNLIFYGLGYKAYKSLIDLPDSLYKNLDLIVIGQDKNVINDYSNEIKTLAERQGISFCYRNEIKEILYSKYHIAIGWRWIINMGETEKLIVFHDSLLPRYRGFNPLVTALINGDLEIGVTALYGTAEYDKGNIIKQKAVKVKYPIKISKAIELVSLLYSEIFREILKDILGNEKIKSIVQDESAATYSLWRDEEDYIIQWSENVDLIIRTIDSLGYPYKGASTYYEGQKIRILEAEKIDDVTIINRQAGKIIFKVENEPVIVCGVGLLKIKLAIYEDGRKVFFDKFRTRLK